jgi:hypothetical protein
MTDAYTDDELAFHEAGHSVMRILLGGTFNRVSIVRDDPARGVRTAQTSMERAKDPVAVRDRVAVLLAGEAAQHLRDCQHPRRAGSNDREQAEVAAASVTQDTDALLQTEWQRVLDMLQRPSTWPRVEAVAQLLLREQTVDGATVQRVVDDLPA